jgi:hypothetical protein
MSNPLIQPGDPRFQRPPLHDDGGKNRFSEEQASGSDAASEATNVFAAPQGDHAQGAQPEYRPEYVSRQPSRNKLMLALAAFSLSSDTAGAIAIWREQWALCAIALFAGAVMGAVSWYLATDEFVGLRAGVVDEEHWGAAWAGIALASLGVLLAVGLAVSALVYGLQTAL